MLSPTRQTMAWSSSTVTSANWRSSREMSFKRVSVVDGQRHADFGGRNHVDRSLIAVEDFEDAAQESVRHQHARGDDVDAA